MDNSSRYKRFRILLHLELCPQNMAQLDELELQAQKALALCCSSDSSNLLSFTLVLLWPEIAALRPLGRLLASSILRCDLPDFESPLLRELFCSETARSSSFIGGCYLTPSWIPSLAQFDSRDLAAWGNPAPCGFFFSSSFVSLGTSCEKAFLSL